MRKPSDLLANTAEPFDSACMKVRSLEEAAVSIFIEKDYRQLFNDEKNLCDLLIEFGLLRLSHNIIFEI